MSHFYHGKSRADSMELILSIQQKITYEKSILMGAILYAKLSLYLSILLAKSINEKNDTWVVGTKK